MAVQKLNSYDDVKNIINKFLDDNRIPLDHHHKRFWNTMSYPQFTTDEVPDIFDADTGDPLHFPILVKGKPDESNLIKALRGTPGTPFDPNNGSIGRMPVGGPQMPPELIDAIADWIQRGCPNP